MNKNLIAITCIVIQTHLVRELLQKFYNTNCMKTHNLMKTSFFLKYTINSPLYSNGN